MFFLFNKMGEEEEVNDEYIILNYYGNKKKIEVPDDYKKLLEAFLKAFDEEKKKKFEFYSYITMMNIQIILTF